MGIYKLEEWSEVRNILKLVRMGCNFFWNNGYLINLKEIEANGLGVLGFIYIVVRWVMFLGLWEYFLVCVCFFMG